MKTDKISTENIYGSELYLQKDQDTKNESRIYFNSC